MTRLLRLVLLSSLCALPCLAQDQGLPPPTGLRRVTRTHGPAWRVVRTEQDARGRRAALVLVRVMRTHGPGYRWLRVPARQERPDPAATRQEEEAAAQLGPQAVERIQQALRELEAVARWSTEELREWSGLTPEEQARRLEEARVARAAEADPAQAGDPATPAPSGDQDAPAPAAPPARGVIDQLEQGGEKEAPPPPPTTRRPRRVS